MKVDFFDFDLPADRIAVRPASPRDSAKLLVVKPSQYEDLHVRDLPSLLKPDDLLIFNDTKVIPARLQGRRGLAKIEVTLHRQVDAAHWRAFARPAKRLKIDDVFEIAEGFSAIVTDKFEAGEILLRFDRSGSELLQAIARHGDMPLPPYIASKRATDAQDKIDYQTMFAVKEGAVAAPTAGLHFTPDLIARLHKQAINLALVTLHVGAGTFLPVKADDTIDHHMHAEWGEVTEATALKIADTRAKGGRIVAIGTTALRLLESAVGDDGAVRSFNGETNIFITPGYQFRVVDLLFTNFHLPRSTLFMLVSAFCGLERMQRAYNHAIAQGYRFYSYGDASLLYPASL